MTLVVLLLLGFGSVLIVSAIEDHSIGQTVAEIWTDSLTIGQGTHPSDAAPFTKGGQPYTQPTVQSAGVHPLIYGSAAGPAQQDAYRQAVVRAYVQSRR